MTTVIANIVGPDLLIVAGIIVLLFGGSQLPKLARSIGQAKQEFEKGQKSEEETTPPRTLPPSSTTDNDAP